MLSRFILALVLGQALLVSAAEPAAEEYHVKGAFLINFAKFVDWPEQVFKGPSDPILICVVGQNPFGPGLERAARDTIVANRSVSVREISDAQQAAQCRIVFLSAAEKKRSRTLLQALQSGSVLTVGEWEGFIASGGVINFRLEEEKVRIEINTASADRAKLRISSKLLSLAQAGKR